MQNRNTIVLIKPVFKKFKCLLSERVSSSCSNNQTASLLRCLVWIVWFGYKSAEMQTSVTGLVFLLARYCVWQIKNNLVINVTCEESWMSELAAKLTHRNRDVLPQLDLSYCTKKHTAEKKWYQRLFCSNVSVREDGVTTSMSTCTMPRPWGWSNQMEVIHP